MMTKNPVLEIWFRRALLLEPGCELFIPCEDRKDRTAMVKSLDKILKEYMNVEPIIGSQLVFRETFRDRGHWVRVLRKPIDPSVLWEKSLDGTIKKITVYVNFKLRRQIELMRRDQYTDEDIFQKLRLRWGDEEVNTYLKEK